MNGVQGGQGNDTMGTIMQVVECVLNPMKLVEKILGGLFGGGDSVSQSQAQTSTGSGTNTELYEPAQWPGYVQGKKKSDDEDMARSLEVIESNWDLFDTANGKFGKDGKVTLAELNMLMTDTSQPQEVRDAARKVAESPWLLN